MSLACSGCCDCCSAPAEGRGLSAHFIMELLMRPGLTPGAEGLQTHLHDGGNCKTPASAGNVLSRACGRAKKGGGMVVVLVVVVRIAPG